MGLDTASIKFLCAAKSLGVNFTNLLMIGRQRLIPDSTSLQLVFSTLEIDCHAEDFLRENQYGEKFFSLLGAQQIDSLDYSSYEDATILHDMNAPIPDDLHQRFSVVYDGGTLEHIFNVPRALKNCMQMVQVGGHFMQVNVANNFMGHGFWQFSPELLFRVFSPANGFEIQTVLLHEVVPRGAWYAVTDPAQIHQRVELCNHSPTYICTIAKRVSDLEIFSAHPLQSDYFPLWDRKSQEQSEPPVDPNLKAATSPKIGQRMRLRHYLPESIKQVLRPLRQQARLFESRLRRKVSSDDVPLAFDRPYYRRIREEKLLRGILE